MTRVNVEYDPTRVRPTRLLLEFCFLQLLDLMTTWSFLRHGVPEANPITGSSYRGVLAAKILACFVGVICWYTGRRRALVLGCVFYVAIVLWNLVAIMRAQG